MAETIHLTIETGNAAFEGSTASEIARILRCVADEFEQDGFSNHPRDINGNVVGTISVKSC